MKNESVTKRSLIRSQHTRRFRWHWLLVTGCVLVFSSCEGDAVAPGIPAFTVSWPDQEAVMLPGEKIVIGVSGGRQPYRLARETNRQIAVSTLERDTIRVNAVDFGIDSLVVEDSNPNGGSKITIRIRIATPSSGVIDINGVVKDVDGIALPGSVLLINGEVVKVGVDGSFSAQDIETPYDATVLLPELQVVQAYRQLSRTDPVFVLLAHTTPPRVGTIEGDLPVPYGAGSSISFVSSGASWHATGVESYSIQVNWWGTLPELAGKLYHSRWHEDPDGNPYYTGIASKEAIVADGQTTVADISIRDVKSPSFIWIGGATDASQSYILFGRQVFVSLDNVPVLLMEEVGALESDFIYKIPVWSGSTYSVKSYAGQLVSSPPLHILNPGAPTDRKKGPSPRVATFTKTGIGASTFDVSTYVGGAPAIETPANGATGVNHETAMRWYQGGGDGVNAAYFLPHDPGGVFFVVLTIGASTALPDYSTYGIALQPGSTYDWYVLQEFSLASINETVTESYIAFLEGKLDDVGIGYSEVSTFTTDNSLR